jgi:hypothetical protein
MYLKLIILIFQLKILVNCEPICYNYRIESGDGLWNLYRRFNTTGERIKEDNPGIDFDNLQRGSKKF